MFGARRVTNRSDDAETVCTEHKPENRVEWRRKKEKKITASEHTLKTGTRSSDDGDFRSALTQISNWNWNICIFSVFKKNKRDERKIKAWAVGVLCRASHISVVAVVLMKHEIECVLFLVHVSRLTGNGPFRLSISRQTAWNIVTYLRRTECEWEREVLFVALTFKLRLKWN